VIDDTADDAEKSFTGGSKAFKAAHDYAMLQSVINGRGISRAKREELLGPEAYRKAGAAGTGAATGGRSDSDAYVNTALGQRP